MLHQHVVILALQTLPVPRVPVSERLEIDDLGYTDDAITHATARFGYMDAPDVPEVIRLLAKADIECAIELDDTTYFLSKIELRAGKAPTMARWRKRLFIATSHIATDAGDPGEAERDLVEAE